MNALSKIRVLLVDDSPIALHLLQKMLSSSPEIEVVGTACDGVEALSMLAKISVDVVCTDLHMPKMDGLELTRRIMAEQPKPILIVSISVQSGSANTFKVIEAGAVDVMSKPVAGNEEETSQKVAELISKIRILSGVHVLRRRSPPVMPALKPFCELPVSYAPKIVVIGSSTGGPQALLEILSHLPKNFSLPILCVQHIGDDFLNEMIRWLDSSCPMSLCKAAAGERPQAGTVYFAPENAHLEIDRAGCFLFNRGEPVDGHRPSVTVTMTSVARYYGSAAVGVLLTGMGRDGADGMAAIRNAGGMTLAQDEASCIVYGMPRVAAEMGVVQHVIALEQVAPTLIGLLKEKGK